MKKVTEHNYYKWSVDKGDYKRDDESTITYQKKLQRKRRIKTIFILLLYFIAVTIVTYYIISGL